MPPGSKICGQGSGLLLEERVEVGLLVVEAHADDLEALGRGTSGRA